MPIRRLLAAATALSLAACGGDTGPVAPVVDGDGSGSDPAGAWELVDAEPAIDVPSDARVTMTVERDGESWQVGGTAACNSYHGTVTTDGGSWQGAGYGATEMGCNEPRMLAEQAYLGALTAADSWTRPATDELVLTGTDVTLRFAELPEVATAELTATTWVLDGLVSGSGPNASVSSPVAGADEATLRLEPGGSVAASTGCRTFSGDWHEQGDEVLLGTFGVRDDSRNVAPDGTPTCDESVVDQEHHVLSVLGDGFRAEIDGQRLTLTSRDGLGLSYRGQ